MARFENSRDYNSMYQNNSQPNESGAERELHVQNVLVRSYLIMFGVLVLSGLVAFYTYTSGLVVTFYADSVLFYGLLIAELVIVMVANGAMARNAVKLSGVLLLAYSIVNGMTLSVVLDAYTSASIIGIFFVAAIMFGALAAYGVFTKKELTTIGKIGYMGLIGAIVLMIVNNFILRSGSMSLFLGVIVLALFIGITAYDSQKIKHMAYNCSSDQVNSIAMMGALNLYLDFINIFLNLLRLFGKRN